MITILGIGQVGNALLRQLQHSIPGVEILLINRTGKAKHPLPEGTKILPADVTNPKSLISIFQKSEMVFSCTDVPYQNWSHFYPMLSNAMVEGLKQSVTKLIFADNIYSYGNLRGLPLHEGLEHRATNTKGRIRAELIRNFDKNGLSHRVAIVKSSDFVGPGITKGIFGLDFLRDIYQGKTVNLPGKINLPHHFTFIDDFAKAMILVAFDPNACNQIWHVPNAPAISQKEWIDLFSKETGKKIHYRPIPKIAIRLAGIFNPFVRELNELSYQFDYPYIIDAQKFISHFGDISTPKSVIVRKTIEWFNTQYQTK
jgi:nucleoside-diphosphate-sugar epimerase